jgi:hypothetical protein
MESETQSFIDFLFIVHSQHVEGVYCIVIAARVLFVGSELPVDVRLQRTAKEH